MRRAEAIIYPTNTTVLSRTDWSRGRSRSARRVSTALLHSPTCSVIVLAPRSACHDRSCLLLLIDTRPSTRSRARSRSPRRCRSRASPDRGAPSLGDLPLGIGALDLLRSAAKQQAHGIQTMHIFFNWPICHLCHFRI